jgi:hypothetical protein
MQLEIVKQRTARTLLMGLLALAAMAGVPISQAASANPQPNVVSLQIRNGAASVGGGGNAGAIHYLQATTSVTMQGGGDFHFDENVRSLAGFVTGNSTEIATP